MMMIDGILVIFGVEFGIERQQTHTHTITDDSSMTTEQSSTPQNYSLT